MLAGRKVIHLVPAFVKAELFAESRAHFEPLLTPGLIDEKWLLLNKYPLPSVAENEAKLIEYADRHGYKVWDSGDDLGLHGSLNYFLKSNPQPEGTILLGFDADSCTMNQKGFDLALVETLCNEPELAMVSMWNHRVTERSIKNWPLKEHLKTVCNRLVYMHPEIEMMDITAMDLDFIMQEGEIKEPYKFYGGIEQFFLSLLRKNNRKLGFLYEFHQLKGGYKTAEDSEYREWKTHHIRTNDGLSFGQWLKMYKGISENDEYNFSGSTT